MLIKYLFKLLLLIYCISNHIWAKHLSQSTNYNSQNKSTARTNAKITSIHSQNNYFSKIRNLRKQNVSSFRRNTYNKYNNQNNSSRRDARFLSWFSNEEKKENSLAEKVSQKVQLHFENLPSRTKESKTQTINIDVGDNFFSFSNIYAQARNVYNVLFPRVSYNSPTTTTTTTMAPLLCTVERQEEAYKEAEAMLECGTANFCIRRNGKIVFAAFGTIGIPRSWVGCYRNRGHPYIPKSEADNLFLIETARDVYALYDIPDIWYPVYREKTSRVLYWIDGIAYDSGTYHEAFAFEDDADKLCFQFEPNGIHDLGSTLPAKFCMDGITNNLFMCEFEPRCI